MCPCEWACVHSGEMRGTHARCAGRRCDDEGVGIHVSVRVGMRLREWACVCASGHPCVRTSGHPCVRASGHPCVHMSGHPCVRASGHPCVCASGHVSMQVRWEGVTIMKGWESVWGDKTYLCGEMQVGTDAMRVRGNASMWVGQGGTHVGTCRPAAGGNPWMWVGCVLSMVGVNTVRCCYIIFSPKFRPYRMDPELIMWPRADQGAGYEGRMDRGEKRVCRVW